MKFVHCELDNIFYIYITRGADEVLFRRILQNNKAVSCFSVERACSINLSLHQGEVEEITCIIGQQAEKRDGR